jgi:membrane protein involved in colicin uptake
MAIEEKDKGQNAQLGVYRAESGVEIVATSVHQANALANSDMKLVRGLRGAGARKAEAAVKAEAEAKAKAEAEAAVKVKK